jgi:23S rRNA (cytosine1962-C5)-methyltransferase
LLEVVLQSGRDRSLRRRHPWVLSGAVARVEGTEDASPAGLARVRSAEGEVLGYGDHSPASKIRVRMLTFGKDAPPEDWLETRVTQALARRAADPLLRGTDALRLVNAEGDALPGLVVDRYRDTVVVKLTSAGMAARRERLSHALHGSSRAEAGFERADSAAARREGFAGRQGPLWGAPPDAPLEIRERERDYAVDVVDGQKTGFYLDQREARDLVQQLAAGRRVLDLFAYTGGFSVAAARGGASHVTLVESSSAALALAERNLSACPEQPERELVRADAFRFLRSAAGEYDLLVVDPPPLARQKRDVPRAARAYKDALLHALGRAAPGARLLAFACSHHVGPELFRKIVFGAALDARRELRVLGVLGQPADHPVSIDHPEGAYLTGLLLEA